MTHGSPLSTSPAQQYASRFAHLDSLRAFAVLLVVVAHAGAGAIVPGGSGVTIFFAISGFIITLLVFRERDRTGGFSLGGFFLRRAMKILPPLVVAVVLPSVIWAMWNPIDWWALGAQIFFVFNWVKMTPAGYLVLPGTGVVWSLSIEEQFYIVFALLWFLLARRGNAVVRLAVVAVVVAAGSLAARISLATFAAAPADRIYYGTDTRVDAIAWGVLAAVVLHQWQRHGSPSRRWTRAIGSDAAFVAALALYLTSLAVRDDWFRDTFRFTLQSVAAALVIVYGFVGDRTPLKRAFLRVSAWRPIAAIGLASYSIYLVHLTVMNAAFPLLQPWPDAVRFPALIVAGVATGLALYWCVEVPVLGWRRRLERASLLKRQHREDAPRRQYAPSRLSTAPIVRTTITTSPVSDQFST